MSTIPTVTKDLLDAMCWVNQCTFRQDFEDDLRELGADDETASDIAFAYRMMKDKDIMSLYEQYAYASKDDKWKTLIAAYNDKHVHEYFSKYRQT